MKNIFISIWCLILLCKVFTFYDSGNCNDAVSDFLKDKKLVSITQSTGRFAPPHYTITSVTIIAETIDKK